MRIIPATEPIQVAHPNILTYGPPGIGKTTLGQMARRVLTIDFDKGAHRAGNRKESIRPDTWGEVEELLKAEAELANFDTILLDTVGRCLDLITVDIIDRTPKYGNNGALTQQGWGVLKTRFRTFLARLNALGKDVVMLAHDKEDKDGDSRIIRPDVQGGSYAEVLKSADLVGYYSMQGRERVIDFAPSERSVGKNPCNWGLVQVPTFAKQPLFLSELLDKAREALGRISGESADVAKAVADWTAKVDEASTPEELTATTASASSLEPPMLKAQVRELIVRKAKEKGWKWDAKASAYQGEKPKPAASATPASEPAPMMASFE